MGNRFLEARPVELLTAITPRLWKMDIPAPTTIAIRNINGTDGLNVRQARSGQARQYRFAYVLWWSLSNVTEGYGAWQTMGHLVVQMSGMLRS